jgi:DNA-binding transcriptional MerR regulator
MLLQREGYVLVREASQILGVSPNTVRAWGADGKIPEFRHPVNNYRLYKRVDLENILKQLERSVSPVAEGTERKKVQ